MEKQWDVFISHASEDKAELVEPLARALQAYGVRVWYDAFELKLGDSLSRSIQQGLLKSCFGLVILSDAFFSKRWTEFELQSLISRVVGGEEILLPIWHKVDQRTIREHSLYLSDLKALSTDMGVDALALEIVKRVRPDILDSHVRIQMSRKMEREPGIPAEVPLKDLHDSPVRHKALPSYLVISCRLIEEVFADVLGLGYRDMVESFAKDWDYEREFVIWSAIANAYVQFLREVRCNVEDLPKKKEATSLLLRYSMTGGDFEAGFENCKVLSVAEQKYLIELYLLNLKHIKDMIQQFRFTDA